MRCQPKRNWLRHKLWTLLSRFTRRWGQDCLNPFTRRACLVHELKCRGLPTQRQVTIPVTYDDLRLDAGLRLDLLVDDCVVVELKAVENMLPVFDAQILTYLKLSGHRLGLLINFNVPLIKDGIKRLIL